MRGHSHGSFRALSISFALAVLLPLAALNGSDGVPDALKGAPATHKQSLVLKVAKAEEGQKLEDFCSDKNGRILALLGPTESSSDSLSGTVTRLFGGKSKPVPKFESAVHVYDASGKLTAKWPVGFSGQAINTAPDGTIIIGGDGRVARFDLNGKKLQEAESPQMTYIKENGDDMRVRAKEQLESDRAMYAEQIKEYEEQLKQIEKAKSEKKSDKKGTSAKQSEDEEDSFQFAELNLKPILQAYKQQLAVLEKKTIDESLKEVVARAARIHAISASHDDVFVTCPAMVGYGYGVWRTDAKLANGKEIVKSLSGCCGQMDVQCHNGELYVCENSRHRVIRYDRDGKEIAHFGKRDREGEGENFGGCCNPMNLCFSKQGNLFVSESNGVVKHFTPDGKYLGIVGVAAVQPGCKNSCVAVNADDSHLYYIDVEKSQIIVLTHKTGSTKK